VAEEYTDREVALVIQRVADLQRKDAEDRGADTTSREDLEASLVEAGIDKALVKRAMASVDLERMQKRRGAITRMPTEVAFEEQFPGRIGQRTFDSMVAELRQHTGATGVVETQGDAMTWRSGPGAGGAMRLALIPTKDATSISLRQDLSTSAWTATLAPAIPGAMIGYFVMRAIAIALGYDPTMGVDEAMLGIPAGGLLGMGAGRFWWSRKAKKQERRLGDLFQRLLVHADDAAAGEGRALPSADASALPPADEAD
jgi:hypothetical protein